MCTKGKGILYHFITQRSLQNVLIFRLLLKITVERLRECVSIHFLSPSRSSYSIITTQIFLFCFVSICTNLLNFFFKHKTDPKNKKKDKKLSPHPHVNIIFLKIIFTIRQLRKKKSTDRKNHI